jgi:hypothetical protein
VIVGDVPAGTSQSDGAYTYLKRVYLWTRGSAEILSLCKEGLSIYKWATQRCYLYAKRACLYTSGQRRDAIPMQRGFIYPQRGNAERVYPYAKRVYLYTSGQCRESLSLCKEGLSMYKRIKTSIYIQGD